MRRLPARIGSKESFISEKTGRCMVRKTANTKALSLNRTIKKISFGGRRAPTVPHSILPLRGLESRASQDPGDQA
jgi:hypothetical protein